MENLNQYFCMLTPARTGMHGNLTPEEEQIFGQHCEFLSRSFDEKLVLQAGTSFEKDESGFAVVIFQAENKTKAVAFMKKDPAVAKGLLKAHVTEYSMFLDRGYLA